MWQGYVSGNFLWEWNRTACLMCCAWSSLTSVQTLMINCCWQLVQTSRTSVEDRACSEAISFYPNFLANLKPPCLLLPCIQHAQCVDSCEQCVQRVPRVCGLLQRRSRISYTKMAPVSTHSPALSKTHSDKTKKAEIFGKEPCPLPCPSWISGLEWQEETYSGRQRSKGSESYPQKQIPKLPTNMGARHSAELHKGSRGRGEQKLISSSLSLMKWSISSPMTRGGLITAINTDGDLHRGRG